MKRKHILIFMILSISICFSLSGKPNYEKELIGTVENEGSLYRAYNDLFTVTNRPYGVLYNFKDIFVADQIDEGGYRFSFAMTGQTLTEMYVYRDFKSKQDFDSTLEIFN